MKKAKVKAISYRDEANLLELFLSSQEKYIFVHGIYYSPDKVPKELDFETHIGWVIDSVLVGIPDDMMWGEYLCRFYLRNAAKEFIEFYDTLYGQQEYSIPILIHNVGEKDLIIKFEGCSETWIIKAGESNNIIPYVSKGEDEGVEKNQNYKNINM